MSSIGKVQTAKAVPVDGAPGAGLAEARRKLEEAQRDLIAFRQENAEWLNEVQMNELARLEITMKAEAAAIDAYGLEGQRGPGAGPDGSGPFGNGDDYYRPRNLTNGWNGNYETTPIDEDRAYIESQTGKYGTYLGSVEAIVSNSQDDILGYSVDDSVKEVYFESRGKDVIVTEVMRDTGEKRSWILKPFDGPIVIDATRTTKGVKIDTSALIGQKVYNWGGSGDDTIIGGVGDDKIVGGAGNDRLYGMGGSDTIYGDHFGDDSGDAGNDILHGGAGRDRLYGGQGLDTHFSSDEGEFKRELEASRLVQDDGWGTAPSNHNWVMSSETSGNKDWTATVDDDGMTIIENKTGVGGTIDVDLAALAQDGVKYTMATAEIGTDNALYLILVGHDASGELKTHKVKIVDFMNFRHSTQNPRDRTITLNIRGTGEADIVDLTALRGSSKLSNGQVINFLGGAGNDIYLGPESELLSQGLELEKLVAGESQGNGTAELEQHRNSIFANAQDKTFTATVNGRRIDITKTPAGPNGTNPPQYDPTKENPLSIAAPDGYTQAYMLDAPDEDNNAATQGYYIVLVKPGDPAETIVVHVADTLHLKPSNIGVLMAKPAGTTGTAPPISMVYLSRLAMQNAFMIDGEGGADILYGQKRATWGQADPLDTVTKDLGMEEETAEE